MEYEVELRKQVVKFVEKQQKHIQDKFNDWIRNDLKTDPYKANDGIMTNETYKDLQVYKKRFGDFRALFIINDTEIIVTVYEMDSRGQIYKKKK